MIFIEIDVCLWLILTRSANSNWNFSFNQRWCLNPVLHINNCSIILLSIMDPLNKSMLWHHTIKLFILFLILTLYCFLVMLFLQSTDAVGVGLWLVTVSSSTTAFCYFSFVCNNGQRFFTWLLIKIDDDTVILKH
jgi:hypothetical protein